VWVVKVIGPAAIDGRRGAEHHARIHRHGLFRGANVVTITDGERTAMYVPLSPTHAKGSSGLP
jgi:hypothetical protein